MQNVLNEVLETKSDLEILSIYEQFRLAKEEKAAFALRKSFIENRIQKEEVNWHGAMKTFVLDEAKDIINRKNTVAIVTQKSSRDYLTRVSPFLVAKLVKEGVDVPDLQELASREALFFSNDAFTKLLSKTCLSLYEGKDSEQMVKKMLYRMASSNKDIKGLLSDIKNDRSIIDVEIKFHKEYQKRKSSPYIKNPEFNWLKEGLLTLFVYNWSKGNMTAAQLFLMKGMRVVNWDEPIYDLLSYLDKDLFKTA